MQASKEFGVSTKVFSRAVIGETLRGMRTLKVAMRRESVALAMPAFQRFKGAAHVRVEWCLHSPSTLRGEK